MTLKIEVRDTFCDPLFIMGCIRDKDTMLVSNLNISDVWNINMTNICHLTSIVDLENQGQTYFLNDLHYLLLNTCYGLDFIIEFNIVEVDKLKKS